jgi:predicted MPP superfamily phosphohydrolase
MMTGLTALVAGCVGVHNALSGPIKRTADFQLAALPKQSKPVRIALLSDVHVGNFVMTRERLGNIVSEVNASHPDIVLLAGDFVIGESPEGTAARALDLEPLINLRARNGVFAVLGNHDHWTDPEAVRSSLRKAGVIVLENEAVRVGAVAIVGIDDRFSNHDDIPRSMRQAEKVGGVPIALTHSPSLSSDLPRTVPLLLAGHTHCGQMFWRRYYNPALICGIIKERSHTIVVTGGIGSGAVPLRYGAPPDWWLLEVRPEGRLSSAIQKVPRSNSPV